MTPLQTISRPLAVGQITTLRTCASMLSAATSRADFQNFMMKNRNENVFDNICIIHLIFEVCGTQLKCCKNSFNSL